MLTILKGANLVLRFVLELCALAAFGLAGYHLGGSSALRFLFGLAAPLAAAGLWGLLASPRAPVRLPDLARLLFEIAFFGSAAVGLAYAGQPALAWALGAAVLSNETLLAVWGQRQAQRPRDR